MPAAEQHGGASKHIQLHCIARTHACGKHGLAAAACGNMHRQSSQHHLVVAPPCQSSLCLCGAARLLPKHHLRKLHGTVRVATPMAWCPCHCPLRRYLRPSAKSAGCYPQPQTPPPSHRWRSRQSQRSSRCGLHG